jgi:hypothetical protein
MTFCFNVYIIFFFFVHQMNVTPGDFVAILGNENLPYWLMKCTIGNGAGTEPVIAGVYMAIKTCKKRHAQDIVRWKLFSPKIEKVWMVSVFAVVSKFLCDEGDGTWSMERDAHERLAARAKMEVEKDFELIPPEKSVHLDEDKIVSIMCCTTQARNQVNYRMRTHQPVSYTHTHTHALNSFPFDFYSFPFDRIHSHSFAFVRIRSNLLAFDHIRLHSFTFVCIRLHSITFVCIRSHSFVFVHIRLHSFTFVCIRSHSFAFVCIRSHSLEMH